MRAAALALLAGLVVAGSARAAPPPVKIGVVTDMAGPLAALTGAGSVAAAQMAVEDCLAGPCAGMVIEVISADHQNKPDVAVAIVRKWIDVDRVDAVTDIIQSAVQLAIQNEARERNRLALFPSGTARLVNEDCAPATGVVWMWDTYGQALGITRPLVKPGSKWFTIVANYAFGTSLEADTAELVRRGGGTMVGSVRHPFGFTGDFSPFLLQAQASGADVIAIGSTGSDLVTILKAAKEFGVGSGKQAVASLVLSLPDVAALGLPTAQGVLVNESFYWDFDEGTRRFGRRFFERQKAMPSANQAGRLLGGVALPQGGGGGRQHRDGGGDGAHARHPDPGRHRAQRDPAARRADAARHLLVSRQGAGREQGAVRLLHAAVHHPGGGGVPAAGRERLPRVEEGLTGAGAGPEARTQDRWNGPASWLLASSAQPRSSGLPHGDRQARMAWDETGTGQREGSNVCVCTAAFLTLFHS